MQASKAGLLEVADVFVINKSDRPGAARPVVTSSRCSTWDGPERGVPRSSTRRRRQAKVWATSGTRSARHRHHLEGGGQLTARRSDRLAQELRRVLLARSEARIHELAAGEEFTTAVKAMVAGELDPYRAADRLLAE